MQKTVIGTMLALAVSGCGGGETSSGPTILQSYEDGEIALFRIKDTVSDYEYTGFGDVTPVTEYASGAIAGLTVTDSSQNGDMYTVNRTGVMADGGEVNLITEGINLNASGSEYASRSLVETSAGSVYVVNGTPLYQAPSGTHRYNGFTEIFEAGNGNIFKETGDASFIVNFNTGAATVTGATTNYVFSSTNMTVDTLSGNFYTANGTIGRRSGVQLDANIAGAVYGTTGLGVGGVVISDLDADDGFFGSFVAVR